MAVTATTRRGKTAATKAAKQQARKSLKPNDDEIRVLAYYLYEKRRAKDTPGDAASDWIEAERRLAGMPSAISSLPNRATAR